MSERQRERRREQVTDLLDAWQGIGVYGRLLLTIAIIIGAVRLFAYAVSLLP